MLLTHQFSIINDQDQSQYQHIGQHRQQRPAPLLFEYEPTSIVENRRTPHQSLTIPSSGPDIESSELERGVNRSTIRQTERQRGFEVVGIEELPSAIDAAWVDQSQEHSSELMQSDPWYFAGHFDARSATGRFSHQRESSLSSLGSTGPASPYTQNTTNPHIAIHDSNSDGFSDLPSHDNTYYQLGKAKGSKDALYADYHATGVDGPVPDLAFSSHAIGMRNECCGRGSLLTRDMPATAVHGHGRSNPTSVASSVADDSPATPSMGEPDYVPRRRPATFASVPKLDRTMTDVYGDELYNPNFTITSASPMAIPISPSNDVFAQRLHAANHQHLSAAQSPISTSSRSRSPFTQGSPLAPARGSDFGSSSSTVSRHKTGSTSIGGERESSTADVVVMRNGQRAPVQSEVETPKTISPQDALLEFNDSEGDANFPLFSPEETTLFGRPGPDRVPADLFEHHGLPSSAGASDDDRSITYGLSQFPNDIRIPQQYPFIAQAHAPQKAMHQGHSVESTSSESLTSQRNSKEFMAEGGTYSCTYHGCTLLFDTPALLQKHKREGHRQAQGISAGRRPESLVAVSMMTQAGPHKCDRINPSTGKPCNTIFSRPYDLTRHEDTIHNARKQKVRCGLCTEEKTFSRADALTRHFRVCHPDVEFPAKHRRRVAHG